MVAGDSFLVPSGASGNHLFVIILGPTPMQERGPQPQVVLVNFSTIRDNVPFDDACPVDVGEHPFITRKSFVQYRYARIDAAEHVRSMVASGAWPHQATCTPELLIKIIAGARRSNRIPNEIKGML
jgi:hypothetical protein